MALFVGFLQLLVIFCIKIAQPFSLGLGSVSPNRISFRLPSFFISSNIVSSIFFS